MKIYDRTKTYARDTIGRDKRQHVMPWAPGPTCSVSQAAERLGVGYETALAMVHKGELQAWPITKNAKSPWRVLSTPSNYGLIASCATTPSTTRN